MMERACPHDSWALGVTAISLMSGHLIFKPATVSWSMCEERISEFVLAAQVDILG